MEWTFYTSPPLDGQINMDIDEEDARKVEHGLLENLNLGFFRVYAWKTPTISLGKNQKIDEQLTNNCKLRSIPIVRRPTGGRAVLHANELTYCVTMPCENTLQAQKAYKTIHLFIKQALSDLHIEDIDFEKSQINFNKHYQNTHSSACFSASARYELTCKNKKLIGSAQRVHNGVLLQHGSLPLDRSHLEIADLLLNDKEQSTFLKQRLHKSSISLSECIGRSITFEETAQLFEDSFLPFSSLIA